MSINNIKRFGPFTPQEIKIACEWLTKNNIEFTHEFDEEAEKRFSENSPENLVNQVEFRTQTYLGSIFYIQADMNHAQEDAFKKATRLTPDTLPEKFKIPSIPEAIHPEVNHKKKAKWARVFLILAIVYAVITLIRR